MSVTLSSSDVQLLFIDLACLSSLPFFPSFCIPSALFGKKLYLGDFIVTYVY